MQPSNWIPSPIGAHPIETAKAPENDGFQVRNLPFSTGFFEGTSYINFRVRVFYPPTSTNQKRRQPTAFGGPETISIRVHLLDDPFNLILAEKKPTRTIDGNSTGSTTGQWGCLNSLGNLL